MKKVILFSLALLCMLVMPVNAKKPKLSNCLWFVMEKQENLNKQPIDSVCCNYTINNGTAFSYTPTIIITIINKSERTIYIDKQNSFVIPNGVTYTLYQNTTKVATQGNTSTTGVNLGLVGVGSSSSNYNTTITQEERFLIIPASSQKIIRVPFVEPWGTSWQLEGVKGHMAMLQENSRAYGAYSTIYIYQNFINEGELLSYEGENNPFSLDMRICYSFNENMTPNYVNKEVYYTKHIIGSVYQPKNPFSTKYEGDRDMALQVLPTLEKYENDNTKYMFVKIKTYEPYQKALQR